MKKIIIVIIVVVLFIPFIKTKNNQRAYCVTIPCPSANEFVHRSVVGLIFGKISNNGYFK